VNVLALAALHVRRRPLPEVLRDEMMEPIEASNTWRWHGYENSWIDLDGRKVQSTTGGGPLGRRHVHQCLGHGALRVSLSPERHLEGSIDCVGEVDSNGAHARTRQRPVRIHELVHEPRARLFVPTPRPFIRPIVLWLLLFHRGLQILLRAHVGGIDAQRLPKVLDGLIEFSL
jgi:hypothetical protein